MYNYRQLSNRLNRNPWEKFKDWVSDSVKHMKESKKKKGKKDDKAKKDDKKKDNH
jgi:mannan polymerase II complex MNN10 subunit